MLTAQGSDILDQFIPYAQQTIDASDIEAVVEALKSKWLTRGPYVEKFEQALSAYCGAKYTVCFNSGTTALQAAYFASNIQVGDLVYTTPNTFAGTVVGALLYGAKLKYVDIDRESGNLSTALLNQELLNTKAEQKKVICAVHFSGIPVDMSAIARRKNENLILIEDAAHSLGGAYKDGKRVGSCALSDMTVLSFHPAKSITTGEGGAVTTNSEELFRRLCLFRNNGIVRDPPHAPFPGYYEVHSATGNYNFTDFQAALGLAQLSKLDFFIEKRRKLSSLYRQYLGWIASIKLFDAAHDSYSAHHLFVIQVDFEKIGKSRAEVMQILKQRNIGTQVHYIPLYRHPAFLDLSQSKWLLSTERYYNSCLTLPLYPSLSEEAVIKICAELASIFKGTNL